ncbi:hypothetical protein CU098_007744 [Rhizopus stolonifer]|uniref:WLM domain-containing protein n=1 Tax=Rhizopus stolonifer TaxID=4846 RepID=A0A367J0B8_RHIST|nr:hypothetical protein CU098_007744 [Rhizopus stolonifer]
MTLHDPVKDYKVLKKKQNSEKALEILKKVSSQVKPILEKRAWTVKNLCEFFPTNPNLLGVNVNRGWKINLRLRPHYDDTQFLEYEDILGTMLHEMAHIKRGPHDEQFYKLLDELKAETEVLMASGYTGEGFQSKGNQLGGSSNPASSRLAAAEAAKKREKLAKIMLPSGGVRLGGTGQKQSTPAQMAAKAAQKRLEDKVWCGGGQTIVIEDSDQEPILIQDSDHEEGKSLKRKRPTVEDPDNNKKVKRTTQGDGDAWKCSTCTFENKPLVLSIGSAHSVLL